MFWFIIFSVVALDILAFQTGFLVGFAENVTLVVIGVVVIVLALIRGILFGGLPSRRGHGFFFRRWW